MSKLFEDLTPAQREAVAHRDGPMLVLAAAGSGKTRVITRRIAHLMEQGVRGRNILALTFTNKAAGEMKERIEAMAPDSGAWVGTFHGLCARLLRIYGEKLGLARGFTIYDQSDRVRAIKDAMEKLGVDESGVTPERVEALISRAKNDMIGPEKMAKWGDADHVAAVSAKVYKVYEERLKASSAVDFDDLLLHMVTILRQHADVRAELDARYRYILVDEYQDTNRAQYAIVRALSRDFPNLCVTGDPDQSIYGWRGANLNNILEFEHDYPGCKVVKLERNYRSTKNILRVADGLIRHNVRRKQKALLTENPEGQPVELTAYGTETEEAQAIAARIAGMVRDGDRSFRDIAVFVRMTALTRGLESALRSARIPYQVVGGVSFYERAEIKDVMAYLSLLANPKDDLAFLRAVNVPARGIGKTTLEHLGARAEALGIPLLAMAREANAVPGIKDKAARALRDFGLLMDELTAVRDHPAEEVIRKLLNLSGYHKFLEKDDKDGNQDRLANIEELVSAAREFDRDHPGGGVIDFLEEVTLASAVDRWKDDGGSVTLMTMHAAKGLEFPVVFILGIEEGILPHSRARDDESQLEEERRLLFVGITRARQELYLSQSRIREFRGQRSATIASRFLSELPEDFLEVRERGGFGDFSGGSTPRRPAVESRPAGRFQLTTAASLAGAGAGPPAPAGSIDALRPGVTVLHPEYGLGRIVAVDGAGPNRKGRIAFAVAGEKTFILAKAPLRAIGQK
ncbi:MAG: UvrD-helicase domain-containing protein [Isosphaeraceae bacterium]